MAEQSALVLIVDDEVDFREIFQTKLTAMGFRVALAENAAEGIAKAKELHPDLVLMDVNMPGMDGAQALLKIKEDPANKNLKVLFLTNLGDPAWEVKNLNNRLSLEAGASGYLKKADDLDALVEQIKAHLNAAQTT